MKNFLLLILGLLLFSCRSGDKPALASAGYNEPHRPLFHFSPKAHWMNDPNGMVYLDGEYHLFYQHYPDGDVWGPMHWGHAISNDLVHWENFPIALFPDSLGMIFSGSAVFDKNNTSGLGTVELPPLVSIFTYHKMEGEKAGRNDYQTQGMAFSLDKGRTWTKYQNNPILKNPGIKDFRDPKVFWHDPSHQWVMILAVLDHVEFYGSPDLKTWNKLGDFGKGYGSHGGVWECPDLFELAVPGETQKKWVMLLSINPGGPNGGSGTQYFIGDFTGKTFLSETPKNDTLWIDYGPDNYAGVTWSNIPGEDGRRIFLGWMSNWAYANVVPTAPWRSAMTIPRELKLSRVDGMLRLSSMPVKELNRIVGNSTQVASIDIRDTVEFDSIVKFPLTMSSIAGQTDAKSFTFEFLNHEDERIRFGFDANSNNYFIERGQSGKAFSEAFTPLSYSPRISKSDKIKFLFYIDRASIELFFDDGINVMTGIFFPSDDFHHMKVYSNDEDLKLDSVEVKQLTAIW